MPNRSIFGVMCLSVFYLFLAILSDEVSKFLMIITPGTHKTLLLHCLQKSLLRTGND